MPSSLRARIARALSPVRHGMAQWSGRRRLAAVLRRAEELAGADLAGWRPAAAEGVILSVVVPAYNTRPRYLDDLLRSFRRQDMPEAELIIVDDGSPDPAARARLAAIREPGVRVILNKENKGIALATQDGLAAARGAWTTFMDHDDALAPHALRLIAKTLQNNPACQFLYTDEVIADGRLAPEDVFLKPAWDEVLLSGVNYVNHLSVYRRDRLLALGGFRAGFDGSQDYDLLLRYTAGLADEEILHLPYPAYVWRRDGASYSARHMERATEKARRALAERYGGAAVAPSTMLPDLHRVAFPPPPGGWPKLSCIMPSREAPALTAKALEGLLAQTRYPNLEVVIPDNGSASAETLAMYEYYARRFPNLKVSIEPGPFNFAASINRGVLLADGDLLLLINNDIEVIEPHWLEEMASCLSYRDVGVVGAKLLYPDRTLQHAGVVVGFGDYAGHWYLDQSENFPGPMGRLAVRQSLTAVTGACLLITRECWSRIGPMDAERFAIAYNDIDLCLRARRAGYRVVWTPFAALIHHESASRGSDETPQNLARFEREKANLKAAYGTHLFADPAINPWFTTDRSFPEPRLLDSLPPARTNEPCLRAPAPALPKGSNK